MIRDLKHLKTRRASSGVSRPVLRKCFICFAEALSPDKEPPFRCEACYARVLENEYDGEL